MQIPRYINLLFVITLLLSFGVCQADTNQTGATPPKYIFLFIGDGMACAQVHATEAYLSANQAGAASSETKTLTMNTFPIHAMQISHASNSMITDSAAAGTALACGQKTKNGVIAKSADLKQDYPSIAELAKSKGMKVGIVSSVSLDHATPASFYAHQNSRSKYEQIAFELLNKNFDYFAGGGFKVNTWKSSKYKNLSNQQRYEIIQQTAVDNGFKYIDSRKDFDQVQSGRVIAINPFLDSSNALPYTINTQNTGEANLKYDRTISLAEFTQKGIDLLENPNGFFMMVEGGKIDWACHANDARTTIDETIALDQAIDVALDFYKAHPNETTIVVTGDHECGGMTLGFAATKYSTSYETLKKQTLSFDEFNNTVVADYTKTHRTSPENIDAEMWQIIFNTFGLDGANITTDKSDNLTEYQKIMLEDAFDKQFNGTSSKPTEQDYILYGSRKPLSVTLTHIINHRAGLSWSSYAHTAIPVPVRAIGNGQQRFSGYYQNTEIALRLAETINIKLN